MSSPHEISNAYFDNIRHNQIGTTDGISPEVAADLGYETAEQAASYVAAVQSDILPRALNYGQEIAAEVDSATPASDPEPQPLQLPETPTRAVLGSMAQKDLTIVDESSPLARGTPANPEGRSPAALRRQQEILANDLRATYRRDNPNGQNWR